MKASTSVAVIAVLAATCEPAAAKSWLRSMLEAQTEMTPTETRDLNDETPKEEGASTRRKLWYELKEVGNNGKPTSAYPLDQCEGDCDNDDDCKGSMKCFKRGGPNGHAPNADVPGCSGNGRKDVDFCVSKNDWFKPEKKPTPRPYPKPMPAYPKPTTNYKPTPNLAEIGNNGKPSSVFPLKECQGDCDTNSECYGHLQCFKRGGNGHPLGTPVPGCMGYGRPGTDFCYDPYSNSYPAPKPTPYPYPKPTPYPYPKPTSAGCGKPTPSYPLKQVGNNGKPSSVFPLQQCQGDCDNDYECAYGLTCFKRGKDSYGYVPDNAPVPGCYGHSKDGIDFCIKIPEDCNPKPTPLPYYPKPTPYANPTPYPYNPPKPTPKPTPYVTHTQEPSMTDVPTKPGYVRY